MERLAYYITPHGFGHAVRSLEVIRQLLVHKPRLQITVVSDIPEYLVEQRVGKSLPFRRRRLDVGLVQKDSVRFDLKATLEALQALFRQSENLIEEELRFLREEGIQTMVSDISFLPFHAARRGGIPGIGLGNFTWDWIYASYARTDPNWHPLIAWIKEGYQRCDLLLQLPMHGDCSSCPTRRDVPLVARKAERNPAQTRRLLGCEPQKKNYLIAFSHLDLDESALQRLAAIDGVTFFHKYPLTFQFANGRSLDASDVSYTEVVAAMDGVITKPGYGIVADCLVHGTPMVFTDRGPFPEYDILVEVIQQHLPNVHLPSQDLYVGAWDGALQKLAGQTRRTPKIRDDGAAVCAELITQNGLLGCRQFTFLPSVFSLTACCSPSEMTDEHPAEAVVMPIEDTLDLHPFQPREVKELLDDYLVAAHEKGFREVRIIHGKGSGVLRERVLSLLKKHPLVVALHQADTSGGGWGATVAVLKSDE